MAVVDLYASDKKRLKQFGEEQAAEGQRSSLGDDLLRRLELRTHLDGIILFIALDGGEWRTDKAYEADGMTVKEGWLRFYWK